MSQPCSICRVNSSDGYKTEKDYLGRPCCYACHVQEQEEKMNEKQVSLEETIIAKLDEIISLLTDSGDKKKRKFK